MRIRIELPTDALAENAQDFVHDFERAFGQSSREESLSCLPVPGPSHRAFPGAETLVFVFQFASAVGAGILANWIYDKLRERKAALIVGNRTLAIESPEDLAKAIDEEATDSRN